MNQVRRAMLLLALPLALAACGKQSPVEATPAGAEAPSPAPVSAQTPIPAKQSASMEVVAQVAKGFETGNRMSAHKVYVFFDPQCPHCGQFWQEAKKLEKDARFIWVPVGLLSPKSLLQGASILNDKNPLLAMEEHEALLMAHKGGMEPAIVQPAEKAVIEQNTQLMMSFGANGVPFLVSTTADGKTFTGNGMPAEELAATLGWRTAPTTAPREGGPVAIAPTALPPTTVGGTH